MLGLETICNKADHNTITPQDKFSVRLLDFVKLKTPQPKLC